MRPKNTNTQFNVPQQYGIERWETIKDMGDEDDGDDDDRGSSLCRWMKEYVDHGMHEHGKMWDVA